MKSGESNSSAGKFHDGTNDLSIVESGGDRFPFYSASQNSQSSDPFTVNNLGTATVLHCIVIIRINYYFEATLRLFKL